MKSILGELGGTRRRARTTTSGRLRPLLFEPLEERCLLAVLTFEVDTIADSGPGSLRQAILDANDNYDPAGPDEIRFNIGEGPFKISLGDEPLTINRPVVIDGYTQPGSSPNTLPPGEGNNAVILVELDGGSSGVGLTIDSEQCTIRGLAIHDFAYGIEISGDDNVVSGNDIQHNDRSGILLTGSQNSIVGNKIGYNGECGILLGRGIGGSAIQNQISENQIGWNTLLGIDLSDLSTDPPDYEPIPDGVTPNDSGDFDLGPNRFQNYPEIFQSPTLTDGELELSYFVDSDSAYATYPLTVEFFVADAGSEGWLTYLGSDVFTTGDLANESKTVNFTGWPVFGGDWVFATATDSDGHTSEFSQGMMIPVSSGIALDKSTNGVDTGSPGDLILPVGSEVVWTYEVGNTGNVPLANVAVTDNQGVTPVYVVGDTDDDDLLAPGEVWVYSATGIVTAGPYENVGMSTAQPNQEGFPEVSDSDTSFYEGRLYGIALDKFTNGMETDLPNDLILPVDSEVVWTYEVSNTGNVPLADVAVTDDDQGVTPVYVDGDTNGNDLLDPGELWVYSATGIVTAGPYENVGMATGQPDLGGFAEVSDSDTSYFFGGVAVITCAAEIVSEDSDFVGKTVLPIGSLFQWVCHVTNNGNVALGDMMLTVDDPEIMPVLLNGDTDADGLLDPGESWSFEAGGVVAAGDHAIVGVFQCDPVAGDGGALPAMARAKATATAAYFGAALSIQGVAFEDMDGDGQHGESEAGIPGSIVYLDLNDNDKLDPNEPRTVTSTDNPLTKNSDEDGHFQFEKLALGEEYVVRQQVPVRYVQSFPGEDRDFAHVVVVGMSETPIQIDFASTVPPDVPDPNPDPVPDPDPPPDPVPDPDPAPVSDLDLAGPAEPSPLLERLFRPSGSLEPDDESNYAVIFPEAVPAAVDRMFVPLEGVTDLPDDLLRVLAESVTPMVHGFEPGDLPPDFAGSLPELTPVDCELKEVLAPQDISESSAPANWRNWAVPGGLLLAALLIWRWQKQRRVEWRRVLQHPVVVGEHRSEKPELDRRSVPWQDTSRPRNDVTASTKENTPEKRV